MNRPEPPADDRVKELLWRYVEGSISPPEEETVREVLARQPRLARQMFEFADELLAIEEALHGTAHSRRARASGAPVRARRRPKAPAWGRWAGLAAACLLAAFGLRMLSRDGGTKTQLRIPQDTAALARLEATEGDVEVATSGSEIFRTVASGTPLRDGDRLRTRLSRASVLFRPGSILYADRFTTLTVDVSESGRPRTSVLEGGVYVHTSPGGNGFVVDTPHGTIVDRGTRFRVQMSPKGTTVIVLEGEVRASTGAGAVSLGTQQEVVLAQRSSPPGPVGRSADPERGLDWVRDLDRSLSSEPISRALPRPPEPFTPQPGELLWGWSFRRPWTGLFGKMETIGPGIDVLRSVRKCGSGWVHKGLFTVPTRGTVRVRHLVTARARVLLILGVFAGTENRNYIHSFDESEPNRWTELYVPIDRFCGWGQPTAPPPGGLVREISLACEQTGEEPPILLVSEVWVLSAAPPRQVGGE